MNIQFAELFQKKQLIFQNCYLYVATYPTEPHVIIENKSDGTVAFSGVDINIVTEISHTLNLIPIFLVPPDNKNRGTIFPNGSATGAAKMVRNSEKES